MQKRRLCQGHLFWLAEDWILWADEESIIKIIVNTYKFAKEYMAKDAPGGKEHIGYIVDRTGFMEYKKYVLEGVTLNPEEIGRASCRERV